MLYMTHAMRFSLKICGLMNLCFKLSRGAHGSADVIASIALAEGHAAEVRVGELVSKTLLPALNDYSLMREELSIPGRDPVFERALAGAAQFALS